jgi:hypothetical protein
MYDVPAENITERPRLVPLVQGNDNGPFALEQTICSKNEFGDEVGE